MEVIIEDAGLTLWKLDMSATGVFGGVSCFLGYSGYWDRTFIK